MIGVTSPFASPESRMQRLSKGASESFEDEKYSYVIASRTTAERPAMARIIKPPKGGSGVVHLPLCSANGQEEHRTISRRQGDAWRLVRKAEWGDAI